MGERFVRTLGKAMNDDTYRIPIETAHKILGTFGITRPTRAYERWIKDDGFDLKDFDEVLFESSYVLIVDWRASLQEQLEAIRDTLAKLDVQLEIQLDEEGISGHVLCGNRRDHVAYLPNDDTNFDDVIRAVWNVVPQNIEFRARRGNEGSDTWIYAVLPTDEWADLGSIDRRVMDYFFVPLA